MSEKEFKQLEALRTAALEQGLTLWAENMQRLINSLKGEQR